MSAVQQAALTEIFCLTSERSICDLQIKTLTWTRLSEFLSTAEVSFGDMHWMEAAFSPSAAIPQRMCKCHHGRADDDSVLSFCRQSRRAAVHCPKRAPPVNLYFR